MYSHLQFDIDSRPETIHAKNLWQQNLNLHHLDNPILQDQGYLKSSSKWTQAHLQAFHIIPILDLEIHHILP